MQTELMQAFGFDEMDLTANRAGHLSEKQEQQWKKNEAWGNRVVLVLALGCGTGAGLVLLPFVRPGQGPDHPVNNLVFGILLLAMALWFLRGAFTRINTDVHRVQGKARLVKSVTRSGSVSDSEIDRTNVVKHELVVGGRAFFVSPHLFNSNVLTEGDTYSIYFIEEPLTLLSLERVAQAQE